MILIIINTGEQLTTNYENCLKYITIAWNGFFSQFRCGWYYHIRLLKLYSNLCTGS